MQLKTKAIALTLLCAAIAATTLWTQSSTKKSQQQSSDAPHPATSTDATVVKTTRFFNDYWLLDNNTRYAVSETHLYRSDDRGNTWHQEKELAHSGYEIQFDKSGTRGWAGDRYTGMELTEDGGQTWRNISPVSIYEKINNKTYREGITSGISAIHLDPETGRGAFTARCAFYSTDNFAQTWSKTQFVNDKGNKACFVDTPFAMNSAGDLALIRDLLYHQLYKYNETSESWEAICELNSSEIGINLCDNDDSLSQHEKDFVSVYQNEESYYGTGHPGTTVREALEMFDSLPVKNMQRAPKRAQDTYWFAERGYLVTSTDFGNNWQIEQDIKSFQKVLPVNETTAFGWNKYGPLWLTNNSGNSWKRVFNNKLSYPLDITLSGNGQDLWALYADRLIHIDTGAQRTTEIQHWTNSVYDKVGATANGKIVWVYDDSGFDAAFSFDNGLTWQKYKASKVQRTGLAKWSAGYILDINCNESSGSCFLLRADDTLTELNWKHGVIAPTSSSSITLPDTDEESDYFRYLLIGSGSPNLIVLREYSDHAYVSTNNGRSWKRESLGASDIWEQALTSNDGNHFLLKGEDGIAISNDFGLSWRHKSFGDGYQFNHCWSADGKTQYLLNDESIVYSTNSGKRWRSYATDYDTWCGINNGYVWLSHQNIEISLLEERDE